MLHPTTIRSSGRRAARLRQVDRLIIIRATTGNWRLDDGDGCCCNASLERNARAKNTLVADRGRIGSRSRVASGRDNFPRREPAVLGLGLRVRDLAADRVSAAAVVDVLVEASVADSRVGFGGPRGDRWELSGRVPFRRI